MTLLPIFVSKKLEQDFKPKEIQPSIVSQQSVLYKFACDLCDINALLNTSIQLSVNIWGARWQKSSQWGPISGSQEMPREIWLPRLRNAIHQRTEA